MEFLYRRQLLSPLLVFTLITLFGSILSRHHIRHHRDRFKRQQGANLYLPGSYVTSGGDGPDRGLWTEWSAPSQCSRTCGGGVSTQQRSCYPGVECEGPTKRHFSCNTQDCQDIADYRSQQCSEYDQIPFDGVYYQWVPYTKAPNPCQLNCMPRGELFYYRHREEVIDGTPCGDEKYDVCVEGMCQPVGCDRMLGSNEVEDPCRICGGDGSMCNTISDFSNMQDLQVGYNDILLIPEGATNIVVQEVAESNNYLAVRNRHGQYYLNGNWSIDFPRTLYFGGCKFYYDRYPKGFMAPDSLRCLGPTNEPLIIVLLYQNANVGVQYQYSVPKGILVGDDNETYSWTFGPYSACSATCGGGVQYRTVTCAGRKSLEPVDRSLCDPNNEPQVAQRCAEQLCEPRWVANPWERCAAACGQSGTQFRQVYCEQIIAQGYPSIVDDRYCLNHEKPEVEQACHRGSVCASWHTEPWKPCDRLCGEGAETRKVTCYRKVDDKIEVLDNYECEIDEEKPEDRRRCNLRPCDGIDWVTSEWSGCENKCESATETRRAECAIQSGDIYPKELCENIPVPVLERQCNISSKICSIQWYATQWSECSAKCGTGIQTRTVFCATVNGEGIKKIDDHNCDPEKKYHDTKDCTADRETCPGEWFTGPWSECSEECGDGERVRKVICMKDNAPASDPAECDPTTLPFQTDYCITRPCREDVTSATDEPQYINETSSTAKPDDGMDYDYEEVFDEECENGQWVNDDDDDTVIPNVPKDDKSQFAEESFLYDFDLMLGDDPSVNGNNDDDDDKCSDDEDNNDKCSDDEDIGSGSTASSEYTDYDYSTEEGSGDSSETTDYTTDEKTSVSTQASTAKSIPLTTIEFIPQVGETDIGAEKEEETEEPLVTLNTESSVDTSSEVSSTEESSESSNTIVTYSSGEAVSSDSTVTITTGSAITSEESSESAMSSEYTSDYEDSSESTESTSSVSTESSSTETEETEPSKITESTSIMPTASEGSSESEETTESKLTESSLSVSTGSTGETESTLEFSSISGLSTETTSEITTASKASSESEPTEFSSPITTEITETEVSTEQKPSESGTIPQSTDTLESSETPSSASTELISSSETETSAVTPTQITSISESTEVSGTSGSTGISSSELSTLSIETVESSSVSTATTEYESTITHTSLSSLSSEYESSSLQSTETSGSSESTESTSELASESTPLQSTDISSSTGTTESTSEHTSAGTSTQSTDISGPTETTESTSDRESASTPVQSTEISGSPETTESSTEGESGSTSVQSTEISSSLETAESSTASGSTETTESSSEGTGSTLIQLTEISSSVETTESSSESESKSTETTESTESSSESESKGTETTSSAESTESSSESDSKSTETTSSAESTESSSESESKGTETTESSSESESKSTETTGSTESTESSATESTVMSSSMSTFESSSEDLTTELSSTESTQLSGSSPTTIESSSSSLVSSESTETSDTVTGGSSTSEYATSEFTTVTDIWSSVESTVITESTPYDVWGTTPISDIFTTKKLRKCRKKVKKDCRKSKYGCCIDKVTPAQGPFDEGCPIIRTCDETRFGCCEDGVSVALGKNYEGCPSTQCAETLFGCCHDNKTTSQGNDYEGCPPPPPECIQSIYGCCEDNITEAQGPNLEGCEPTTTELTTESTTEATTETTFISTESSESSSISTESSPITESTSSESSTSESTVLTTTQFSTETVLCEDSTFSCCPDGVSSATGIDYEGCDIFSDNCTESYFGCCPDLVTSATGPSYKGCKMPCEESLFGCCEDGVTPSHGSYREGCCLNTQYGCCPDNIRPSQGPNLEGCGCQYSPYRCCPDNVTSAQGYYNEGCGCQYTRFGCCPDNYTPAPASKFEGCSCRTFQFGCCPDGVTIAQGSQQQGCGCRFTEFGCCDDGKTPAEGVDQQGCGCETSEHGCCLDGVSVALGTNFEGCTEVPVNLQASCGIEKEKGPCSNYTVKWFFDLEYGGCSRFWYGGCDGNDNRFKSKEDCDNICIEPQGKDRCSLPKVSGACEGYYPKWHYDRERKTCAQFVYSGCLGNNNKFDTREECVDLCSEDSGVDPCEQSKDEGPCRGGFIRWYYDKATGSCNQFMYGGCKPNGNNFLTEFACKQQCTRVDRKKDKCSLPIAKGNCNNQEARWYYDQTEQRCMPFYYTDCDGNNNNFISQVACEADCPKEIVKGTCQLPSEIGDCGNYVQRWYYDTTYQQCRPFYYGGCGGNGNNFESELDCEGRCHIVITTPVPVTVPPTTPATIGPFRPEYCFLDNEVGPCRNFDPRWYYDRNDGSCKQFMYGGCPGNGNNFYTDTECEENCGSVQDICTLPHLAGPCGSKYERWYYNPGTDMCEPFDYGGCLGNSNRFYDKYACEQRCQKHRSTVTSRSLVTFAPPHRTVPTSPSELSICYVPVDTGTCSDSLPSYYYDTLVQKCLAFVYTGCGGNANRFTSEEQCERQCGRFRGLDVCNLPRDPGPCHGYLRKFYFDAVYGHCGQFVYGGCDGNGNRFSSQEECENVCVSREEQKPALITNETKSIICRLPLDVGPCEGGYYKQYYFDDSRGECAPFIYSGCGGNFNNFKTFQACNDFCKDFVVPTEPQILTHTGGEEQQKCQQYLEECGSILCEYGTEAYVDDEIACTKCRCHDPCRAIICRGDQQCAVDLNRNRTTYEDPTFIAVCRDTHKEGECPHIRSHGNRCERDCETDADCTLDLKCCATNCGTVCIAPQIQIPAQLITSSPLPAYTQPHSIYYPPKVIEGRFKPEVSAGEGDYATLDCSVQGNPTPRIAWKRGHLLIDGTQPRYRLLLDGTLQIITLHKTDSGIYLCAADNGMGRPIQKEINLEVTDSEPHATSIVGDQENSHIVASLGAPTTLQCYATGFPFPAVTWWKDDRMVPLHTHQFEIHKDYSLLIHSVQLSNLGIYTCQAYNGIGKAASWSVTIQTLGPVYSTRPEDVKYMQYVINAPERPTPFIPTVPTVPPTSTPTPTPYKPELPITHNISDLISTTTLSKENFYQVPVKVHIIPTHTTYPAGRDISIGCDVEGYPIPQVYWYKDGRPITPSPSVQISESHRLSIYKANQSESGEYRCEAANSYSRSYSSITITVQESKIHPNCTDNPFFANCELIVRARYCIHKYYARFCCKSCTEAGQLQGTDLSVSDDREEALRSNLIRRK